MSPAPSPATFDSACELLEATLADSSRREIVDQVADAPDLPSAFRRTADQMRQHTWRTARGTRSFAPMIAGLDRRTRADGLHVLHDWDGRSDAVNPDVIPLDALQFVLAQSGTSEAPDRAALAIALDYYFVYLLALVSMRIWDAGDADANLDRVTALLGQLQGPMGSGHRFLGDGPALMLLATSHYERDERGYDRLLARTRTLSAGHRLTIARQHAAAMGHHLRFGFEATYGRDFGATRADNVADYPWLAFSLATVMDEYDRLAARADAADERERLAETILHGLSPDPVAFTGGQAPPVLVPVRRDWERFHDLLERHRGDLTDRFEPFRPSPDRYSPLALFFNFSQNVVKGIVVDALLWGEPRTVTLNDLLTALPREEPASGAKLTLARALMAYARSRPDRIRGRPMPVIVYDPQAGRGAFSGVIRALRGSS